jgi:hypothetical protein
LSVRGNPERDFAAGKIKSENIPSRTLEQAEAQHVVFGSEPQSRRDICGSTRDGILLERCAIKLAPNQQRHMARRLLHGWEWILA